jgi:diguanylate cyclase (GGDEF)-like protein
LIDSVGTPGALGPAGGCGALSRHDWPVSGPLPLRHARVLSAWGAAALAMGGSNQSLFLLTALVATQGSAAVPLLMGGLLLAWMAAPGWTELSLMWPDRVGGIAATCAEAFRPYSPVLANLTGVCYWWGWVPTCGLTALLSASALHFWYLPGVPVTPMAVVIVVVFTVLNVLGIGRVTRVVKIIAAGSAGLAFLSAALPVLHGDVDLGRAFRWDLTTPFTGAFGGITSAMAGLYLIGFAAPAFEAATCHVGEMRNPVRDLPRAMLLSGGMAGVYFLVLPLVWLGVFGAPGLSDANGVQLAYVLGPTFAPLFGGLAKSAAIWFMVLNMFHGTVQPLAGAARTLSQLAEDGLLPRTVERRNRFDVPWVATCLTAGAAIVFLLAGDPIWMLAAANFTYLIGIGLPSVAVWLLRRNFPDQARPWRAARGTIVLGVVAATVWLASTVLGFQQFGLPVVLFGLVLAYSGSVFYSWRSWRDRRRRGASPVARSLHLKLTGAMLAVMVLDGAGYALAVAAVPAEDIALVAVLEDIFVVVAILTVAVGLVLPGMIGHSAVQVTQAATRLSKGTLADLTRAMQALGRGDLDAARATPDTTHVAITSRDELGAMAAAFNTMQDEVTRAATSLDAARRQLQLSRGELEYLATHDALTDLPNRRHLEVEIDRIVAACLAGGLPGAVVVFDLDGFKYINDSRGHAVGDLVLVRVAHLLQAGMRPGDLVGRLGGDEFAAVFPGAREDDALGVVHRLLEALRAEAIIVTDGPAVRLTASVGMSFFDEHQPRSAQDLLIDADVAMYDAKDAGRDRLALSSAAQPRQADVRGRHTWVDRIREALDTDLFVLHAQPILNLRLDTVDRYELLLRMRNPDGSLVMPAEFLPAAERSGLITQIDRWVITEACRMLGDCQRASHNLHFEVNLSGLSIGDPQLLQLIERGIAGLPKRGGLVIEVTETAAIVDVERARLFAEHLATLGCAFALDDFGAGYGSFYYLKHLPFDYLKIDGEFIRNIVTSHPDQVLVRSLVQIAQELGKQTVAEFVEDAATLDLLRQLGVDFAQGYFVGRPATLPDWPAAPTGTLLSSVGGAGATLGG